MHYQHGQWQLKLCGGPVFLTIGAIILSSVTAISIHQLYDLTGQQTDWIRIAGISTSLTHVSITNSMLMLVELHIA